MKKLRLNLDALAVESFDPSGDEVAQPGTVRGHALNSDMCPEGTGGTGSTDVTGCGSCAATACATCYGSCYDPSCGASYCMCETNWGTCAPFCG